MSTPCLTLVTGATGKSGGAVARQLLAEGRPVRALVRRLDARATALQRQGAEILVCSLQDTDALRAALRGVTAAYYVPPFNADTLRAAASFAAAARGSDLRVLVQLSQWLSSPRHPAVMTRDTWLIDQMLPLLPGVIHVRLNPGMFADNVLRTLDMAVHLGVLPVLTGDSASAPISDEDLARAVCAVLRDPAPHAGRSLRPTGPELLKGQDMARIVSDVLGRPVRPMPTPFWLFNRAARASGASVHEVLSYREYLRDHRGGAFSVGAGVTSVLEDLTGRPAEPFEATVRRHLARPEMRPGRGRRLRALGRFFSLPLRPGFDLRRYETGLHLDPPAGQRLCTEDEAWLAAQRERAPRGRSVASDRCSADFAEPGHARA